MTTKTQGSSGVGILALIVVVGLGAFFIRSHAPSGNNDEPRAVVLTGIWDPSPRLPDGVYVRTSVGKMLKHDRVESVAPWWRSYTAKRGDRVEIRLQLRGQASSFVGCSITVDGLEVDNEHRTDLPGGDEIVCWAVV